MRGRRWERLWRSCGGEGWREDMGRASRSKSGIPDSKDANGRFVDHPRPVRSVRTGPTCRYRTGLEMEFDL